MSDVSISLSGRPASFARRRLRAAVNELLEKLFLTIFVISFALLPNRFPSGYDANDFILGFVLDGVSNQHEDNAAGQTQGLPSGFATFNSVLIHQRIRICKNQHCVFKSDAMLALVAHGIGVVPLEI